MIYSFSRLNFYATCPMRFRFKYLDGLKEEISKPLALGKAVHKAIESKINGDTFSEAVLNGFIEADFHRDVSFLEIAHLVRRAPVKKGIGQTEVYFKLPLSSSPSAPYVQGYIDWVKGNRMMDWKTHWKPYSVMANHQMGLYAWALKQLKGYPIVEASVYFLRFNKESKRFFRLTDIEKAHQWAETMANEIEGKLSISKIVPEERDRLFPATPSSACRHCFFVVHCYQKTKGRHLNERSTNRGI